MKSKSNMRKFNESDARRIKTTIEETLALIEDLESADNVGYAKELIIRTLAKLYEIEHQCSTLKNRCFFELCDINSKYDWEIYNEELYETCEETHD